MPSKKFEKFMTDLGYDGKNLIIRQEPDYSIKKIHEFESKYNTSSDDIIKQNFKLCNKIPYDTIKKWLSYIDTAQYFSE